MCFIGEIPDPASFKSPWENKKSEEEKKEEKKEQGKKEEEKKEEDKDEHWQEDKFLYRRDFGENLNGKKRAGIFIFDLNENKINQVFGIPDDLHP